MFSRQRRQRPSIDRIVIRGQVMPKGSSVKRSSVLLMHHPGPGSSRTEHGEGSRTGPSGIR